MKIDPAFEAVTNGARVGLPLGWHFLGPDPLHQGAGWWDTGRGISVLVEFRQIIAAMDWRRDHEEPDIWRAS